MSRLNKWRQHKETRWAIRVRYADAQQWFLQNGPCAPNAPEFKTGLSGDTSFRTQHEALMQMQNVRGEVKGQMMMVRVRVTTEYETEDPNE